MNHQLGFIRLRTNKIYFDKRSVVTPLIKRFIKKFKMAKLQIPMSKHEASVSATFLPSLNTLKKGTDVLCSVIVCTSLSSDDKNKDFRLSFIENELDVDIGNSSMWGFKELKRYLKRIPNLITMAAPALRKDTHLTYDLFSADNVIGEIHVPDMINVFYTKLKHDPRFKENN